MPWLVSKLRFLFFLLIVRPIMLIVLGFNVRNYDRLPRKGPLLIVANHNSHLDALALITLFGMKQLKHVRTVAAADYFLKNRFLAWFSVNIIGIIPFDRRMKNSGCKRDHPLSPISDALGESKIVILFPEGSRGEPEKLDEFKSGVAHIAKRHPDLLVIPIFMYGFGKSLPRGEALFVPFICDLFIGEPLKWTGDRVSFMDLLNSIIRSLADDADVST